ncbi:50S ribosomal protein L23 [bacterium]|nr:50S ribosomal protein L23 [bacterium]
MNKERLLKVLVSPHVSEKAAMAGNGTNQVVFRVARDANKIEIKQAVELLFKVEVDAVQVLNMKGKVKRNRYGESRRPTWKKAYVKLAAGHDIDLERAE